MSTVKQKYLKDESGSKISPITSGDSVFDKTNNPITEWDGYEGSLAGWYIFPNGRMIIQWGQQKLSTTNSWLQDGNDYYKNVNLYQSIFGGECFANFSYANGINHAGATLLKSSGSTNFNIVRLRTKVNPADIKGECNINWFVIGVLS